MKKLIYVIVIIRIVTQLLTMVNLIIFGMVNSSIQREGLLYRWNDINNWHGCKFCAAANLA